MSKKNCNSKLEFCSRFLEISYKIKKYWIFSKSIVRFAFCQIVDFFIMLDLRKRKADEKIRRILIIRLDGIGDYILFRNFIKILKESDQYKDCEITLCGNVLWKNLAESLDGEYINNFIWIDRGKYFTNILYKYMKIIEITKQGYEIAIQTTFSREYYYGDNIVKFVNAKEKIGSLGDLSNIKKWQKNISNKYYTKLISGESAITFEFYRNKEFFEKWLDLKVDIVKPYLDLSKIITSTAIPEISYVVFFIGASREYRKWNPEYFAEVAKFIYEQYGFQIVICGTTSDKNNAKIIQKSLNFKTLDLTGTTSLLDLIFIISKAKLLISNETVAPHIAVATDTAVIVIYNGNHFGRFTPYPKEMVNSYQVSYHPAIENNPESYKMLTNIYGIGSDLDVNEIKPERVIKIITDLVAIPQFE